MLEGFAKIFKKRFIFINMLSLITRVIELGIIAFSFIFNESNNDQISSWQKTIFWFLFMVGFFLGVFLLILFLKKSINYSSFKDKEKKSQIYSKYQRTI